MNTIWKYPLALVDHMQGMVMPTGAEVLSVAMQHGVPTLWAQVDTDTQSICTRLFIVVGTGHAIPEVPLKFVGTVMDGPFVWHVFEALR